MRNLWILLTIVSLLDTAFPVRAIEYDSAQSIWLNVRTSSQKTTPGVPVRLTITFGDKDHAVGTNGSIQQTIDDPVKLTWQATGGQLSKWSAGEQQPIELSFSAMQPGYYAILLVAEDSGRFADEPSKRRIIEISVRQENTTVVPTIRVGANPQTIRLDKGNSSTITAQLLGKDIAGKEVRFFSTDGSLSASSAMTDANGLASVLLTPTKRDIGSVDVLAYTGGSESSVTVEVIDRAPHPRNPNPLPDPPTPPAYQPDFLISVNPQSLPADGRSKADVTVRLTDARGRGLPRRAVDFSSPSVRIRPQHALTDFNGYARAELIAEKKPGKALIFAQSGAMRSYATVTFIDDIPAPTGPPRLFLTVNPTAVPADGKSRLLVAVLVLDSNGFAVPGVPIDFSSTLGAVQYPRVITDKTGQAGTYLFAPATPGIAVVSAAYGNLTAASQVAFQGVTAITGGLDIRSWSEQQMAFVAEKWFYRAINQPDSTMRTLTILDANGKLLKQFDLGKNSLLIRDQFGIAHGFGTEDGPKVKLEVLKPDGSTQRTVTFDIPVGSHLVDLQYAEPSGHLLATLAAPDGSMPEVRFLSPAGTPLLTLDKGLEKMPLLALNGDGYLGIALAGGTIQVFGPAGKPITEIRRTDGLPASQIVVGPEGEWVAVAAALAGQTETPPRLLVYSRQGAAFFDNQIDGQRLVPAGKDGLLVSTPDSTYFINLKTRSTIWKMPGGFERAYALRDTAVIASRLRDAQLDMLTSRIAIVRLSDGTALGGQVFAEDFREFRAILPPDGSGQIGVITTHYTFRFPLPAEK